MIVNFSYLRPLDSPAHDIILDLKGLPVQYREVQGYESSKFLSYFLRFTSLQGGVSSGFHHVTAPLPLHARRLYRVAVVQDRHRPGKSSLVIREVPASASSLERGDVFVSTRDRLCGNSTRGSAWVKKGLGRLS